MDQTQAVNLPELTLPPKSLHYLATQHGQLETQLQQLNQKRFLSAAEEMECQRLKKLKLQLKDEMEQLRRATELR